MSPLTITRRLIVLVAVPLLFTGGFAAWALATTGSQALSASRLEDLVSVAAHAGRVADGLQQERTAAVLVLTGDSPFEQLQDFERRLAATDDAVANYLVERRQVSGAPAGAEVLLSHVDRQIARLPALREEVRAGPTAAVSAVALSYRITISDLISLRETVAQAEGGSVALVGHIRADAALSSATEFVARRQVEVLQNVAAGGPSTPADQQVMLATRAGYDEAMASFATLAPPEWQDWLDHALTGPDVLTAQRLENVAVRAPVGTVLEIDRAQWLAATTAQLTLLHTVERQVDAAVGAEVRDGYVDNVRLLVVEVVVVVAALMAAVVAAVLQSRSMIRRLRRLADSARTTAFVSLPNLVERLRAIGARTLDPEDFANQATPPLFDQNRDEIADVSSAFVAVHRQAVKTAADLANMRTGLSQIFVHLARRNQRLVAGLIHELDGAEQGEQDPERLATLFRLDQLATRMGRYTDNLLVVGGQTASRAGGEHVSLEIVLRGAQSKIESFPRVRYADSDDRLTVRGDAVHDLMNLLAELLDNATLFSPPSDLVTVHCGVLRDRVLIRISDLGVGIPPARLEALNATLSAPPSIDVASIRSMGLTVVAHIARQYGIRVSLFPGARLGTVAEVELPPSLCWVTERQRPRPPAPRGPDAPYSLVANLRTEPPIFQSVVSHFVGFFGENEPSWRGAADQGWTAASAAAAPQVGGRTTSGLPLRAPMANLVPGGVAESGGGAGAVDYRKPALVAASVAAFARGNAHSRALREHPGAPAVRTPEEMQ